MAPGYFRGLLTRREATTAANAGNRITLPRHRTALRYNQFCHQTLIPYGFIVRTNHSFWLKSFVMWKKISDGIYEISYSEKNSSIDAKVAMSLCLFIVMSMVKIETNAPARQYIETYVTHHSGIQDLLYEPITVCMWEKSASRECNFLYYYAVGRLWLRAFHAWKG